MQLTFHTAPKKPTVSKKSVTISESTSKGSTGEKSKGGTKSGTKKK